MSTLSESSESETEPHVSTDNLSNNWNNNISSFKQSQDSGTSDTDNDHSSEWSSTIRKSFGNSKRKIDSSSDENAKRQKIGTEVSSNAVVFNPIARNMMKNMGYKEGTGLGKYGQGRTEIVEMSKQRGRRGLGLHLQGFEPAHVEWDFTKEKVSVVEEPIWMPECTEEPPTSEELQCWIKEGPKKMTIDDEDTFCHPVVLKNILACKSVFDELEPEEMRRARTRSNPFETIRGVIFQNRAAVKMANMDAAFDFMFTDPKDEDGNSVLDNHELLYFADVCAGPGGFSEYILWRKKWEAKGFGFTLRGPNDFKLEEFFAGPPESFEPYYGKNGLEGDGDVYIPENLKAFRKFVLENTDGKGVHFIMADGGFSVEGEENLQEILSKRLYLCQFLCALSILRTGGHFVCKLFDLFTPFSVGLVYLMYRAFRNICIHKPNTSRPANSERYIICKHRLPNTEDIHDYMYDANCRLGQLTSALSRNDCDIVEIVPLDKLKNDIQFFEYITESNNRIGDQQVIHLAKIKAFAQNTELYEEKQSDLRKECLELWNLPDKVRSAPSRSDPLSKFRELVSGESTNYLTTKVEELNLKNLKSIKSIYDYCCIISGVEKTNTSDRTFFLGLGRSHIYKWDNFYKWNKVDLAMELPANTLVFAEIVQELKGEGRAQRKINAMHVIDALYLGGKDVRKLQFAERMTMAKKLIKAVSKPSRTDFIPLRVKDVYQFEEINLVFERLDMKIVKGSSGMPRLCYKMEDERHFLPTGLFFMKTVEEPWMIALSKTSNRKYYFNSKTKQSLFDPPKEALASFKTCYTKRLFWAWEPGVKLLDCHKEMDGKIHRDTIMDFVYQRI